MSADRPFVCSSCTHEVAEDDVYLHYDGAKVVCLRCFRTEDEHETPTAHNWRQGHDAAAKPLVVATSICVYCHVEQPIAEFWREFGVRPNGSRYETGICRGCQEQREAAREYEARAITGGLSNGLEDDDGRLYA